MSVITVAESFEQVNSASPNDYDELALYTAGVNEWIEDRVTDTSKAYVKVAALFFVDHLWTSQRGPSGTPLSEETIEVGGLGYAVPNRVLELLDPGLARAAPVGSFPTSRGWPDPVESDS